MKRRETHQLSADLGAVELWCSKCRGNVAHDFTVTTDAGRVVALIAECDEGHRQRII